MKQLNKYIDHTILKPDATINDIIKLCIEAKKYNFASVCINPIYINLAVETLQTSDIKVCTVIGFPLGANTTKTKVFETKLAVKSNADEIDMVINIGEVKNNNWNLVLKDIKAVRRAAVGKILKVIIETALLTTDEIIKVSKLILKTKADFIKTSTGFASEGATIENIKLIKSVVKDKIQIKASGGIYDYQSALEMIDVGATRIGTSSGVKIISEQK